MMETEFTIRDPSKNGILYSLARSLWPGLETMSEQRRLVGIGDVFSFLYAFPFALVGLVWLAQVTDRDVFITQYPVLFIIFGLMALFSQVSYFIIVEIRTDRYGSSDGSLSSMILWSAVFLFGPTALWLNVLWNGLNFLFNWRKTNSIATRWNLARNFTFEIAINTFAFLVALAVYQSLGGEIPVPGLSTGTIAIAFVTLIVHLVLTVLVWLGYVLYHLRVQKSLESRTSIQPIIKFFALSFGLPYLSHPFSILAAGLYVQNGFSIYLFFITGLLLVAYLARRLSWAAESNRQRSRQLERLEKLGRALIDAPPDASTLSRLLEEHVPNMFPSGYLSIWLNPGEVVFKYPADWPAVAEEAWQWILDQDQPRAFTSKDSLPWDSNLKEHQSIVIAPILESESANPIGGIYVELRSLAQPWDPHSLEALFPAIQTLGAQVASALHQVDVYAQTLSYQNVSQELRLAGRIQASFLPNKFPTIPGWQFAVTLQPARETSGDFFDVIELSNGRLGVLIADVADKGVGPALYMALSRTLLRTFALDYDADPEVVFFATNGRLLGDARANLFVTCFFGILDPGTGTLTYANAGHNPPILVQKSETERVRSLGRTGIAMGIEEEATWKQERQTIRPGDILILYTDGIPDAQNEEGEFFDEERIIEIATSHLGQPAHEIQTAILNEIQKFVGNTPQSDDITLMILVRDA
jgi:serine phosphatase RsbU (regulator of sigma subunit)